MLPLAITGFDADPDLVTQTVGFEPAAIGRKGEPLASGKPRTFNGWWFEVDGQRPLDSKQHDALVRILVQLEGRED